MTGPNSSPDRPAATTDAAGMLTHYRGPFADGPKPEALLIDAPRLDRFGLAELRRMMVIGFVLVAAVVRAVAGWVLRRRGRSLATAVSEGVVDGFEQLGPTFVKLGQLIASSPGLFPTALADAALRTLDEVPPFDPATVRRMVAAELGRPPGQVFRSFDDRPLSAASIAQVHAVVLPDGRDAVIKLQRPDIAHRMNTDLRIQYFLASKLLNRFEAAQRANVTGMVEDLHEVTNQELNAVLEAHRQTRFRDHIGDYGDNTHITAPEVYWDYCTPHMICMERMSGVPMDQFDELARRNIDGELVLRRGIKVWIEAALVHGPFHGDVHAGNLWVLDDGRATYLDFGIMGELPDEWKHALGEIMYTAMIDQDYRRVVRAYQSVGVMPADVDPEVAGPAIAMVMEPMLSRSLGQTSLGEALKSNLELAEQFGARTPRELLLVAKQLLYFERYATTLAPDYVMARDLYLLRNVFPEAVERVCEEKGITLPD
ncbi:MAG: AarF/ABC1/UbiB kinase family protein [Acidimicrobiales bacterium]|nr:AarF/ABC1/UbiB kinase family protein [Acidimicrobiales bacterium]